MKVGSLKLNKKNLYNCRARCNKNVKNLRAIKDH